MSNSIEISRDNKIRFDFFIGALTNDFGWYFDGFGLPTSLLKHNNCLLKKSKFSLRALLLKRQAKRFFDESDEHFQNDIEKMYGFLEDKKGLIEKAYSYVPFFTKDNWSHKKLKVIVLPMNSSISSNDGVICLGIRPPEQIDHPQISHAIHEMIHLNIQESSESFLNSEDEFQIDAEELYATLLTQKICDYMKIENFKKNKLPHSLDKYIGQKNELLGINIDTWENTEEALHSISNILKKTPKSGA